MSLVKNFVEYHKGTIELKSEPGKGSTFIIKLPFKNKCTGDSTTPSSIGCKEVIYRYNGQPSNSEKKDEPYNYIPENNEFVKKHTIIVAEDNSELRNFISNLLINEYNIIETSNGSEAFDRANEIQPDLIISDILMPKLNGYQLCQKIKQNIHTSHIPIIILTALSSESNQIEGLTEGADDYITKPFNPNILSLKVKNTIHNRSALIMRFKTEAAMEPGEIVTTSKDETFLMNTIEAIKSHISDPNFKVDQLLLKIGMSRSPFFRKIKALTGQTPSDFIRTIRLKHAAKLLIESDLNISEAAFNTGFTSPIHFRECFKKQYGQTPRDYVKNHTTTCLKSN